MKILQSRSFEQKVKKFGKQEKKALDKQILKIAENPSIGAEKKAISVEYTLINSELKALNIYFPIALSELILN
ncbi:MAG: type II toxin-antitoxin system RelE/ParE family toxin [Thermodesulfobacteriota bacterium]|nr:type II toxin-antitoxin system RelE/ParE family toxin [Thermodesulfobacteriota bacterium]